MNTADFEKLPLPARTMYAIMCFERYAAFVYAGVSFKPVEELMWQLVDGSEPVAEASARYLDIIPENLFAYKTYAAYSEAGHDCLTEEQHRILRRVLNPDDWNLNSMMKQIYTLAKAGASADEAADEAETLACLENITNILKVRSIELPDLRQLVQDPSEDRSEDADDPSASAVSDDGAEDADGAPEGSAAKANPAARNVNTVPKLRSAFGAGSNSFEGTAVKSNTKNMFPAFSASARPVVNANGCKWEIAEDPESCSIVKCINSGFQKEVTIPSELSGRPVVAVENSAFTSQPEFGCMAIETLIMPDTIRQIGDDFFHGCTGLRHITLPAELECIGSRAFRGASRLESLTVGDHCRSIGDMFCTDAVSLRSVTIGAGVEAIGEYSFYNTPLLSEFRCDGTLKMLGYGSFWMNKFADSIIFNPLTEMLRICKGGSLLYRYVKRNPPPRLFFDAVIQYVYDFAFGGDAWHAGDGIRDIYFPGAEIIGVQAFKKVPNATVHLSAARMEASYGPDYEYTLTSLCAPAKVVFDQP